VWAIASLLVNIPSQCKEKQYLDRFITLLVFFHLLVVPFSENGILEELLADGMAV